MHKEKLKIALIIVVAVILPGGLPMLAAYTAARKAKAMCEDQNAVVEEAA